MKFSMFEAEQLITRAGVGEIVVGLKRSEALALQEIAKSFGRKTRLQVEDQETGTHRVEFVETPGETLNRLRRPRPLE